VRLRAHIQTVFILVQFHSLGCPGRSSELATGQGAPPQDPARQNPCEYPGSHQNVGPTRSTHLPGVGGPLGFCLILYSFQHSVPNPTWSFLMYLKLQLASALCTGLAKTMISLCCSVLIAPRQGARGDCEVLPLTQTALL
jgi:hypothetical protein